MAVTDGIDQVICYVNPSFCRLVGKNREEIIGKTCAELLPKEDKCLLLLDRVYRTGNTESYTQADHAKPHAIYWSYEISPVFGELQDVDTPVGTLLQVTETAPFHRRASFITAARRWKGAVSVT